MKIARFRHHHQIHHGIVQEDQRSVTVIEGDLFHTFEPTDQQIPLADVELLPPVAPRKLICVGLNYASHAKESNIPKIPEEPLIFLCSPSAIIADQQTIQLSNAQDRIDYEAELAVIIQKTCKDLHPSEVPKAIFGYTCANDVSNRNLQKKDGQFTRAKSFDTYKPLGPWIETELDLDHAKISLFQNGQMKQSALITDMIFTVTKIVQFLSTIMTLEPGDTILTGTPAGVGPLSHGDKIEIEISGIGRLTNRVSVK